MMSSKCPFWCYYVILAMLFLVNSTCLLMFVTKFKQYFSSTLYKDCGIVPILILQDAANVILWMLTFKVDSIDFIFGNVLFTCKQILSSFFILLLLFIYPIHLWLPLVMLKCVVPSFSLSTLCGQFDKDGASTGQSSSVHIQHVLTVPILLASVPILKLALGYFYRDINFSGHIILFLFLLLHTCTFLPDRLDKTVVQDFSTKRYCLGKDVGMLTTLRAAANSLGPTGIVRIVVLIPVVFDVPAIVFYAIPSSDLIHLSCFLFTCNITSMLSSLLVAFSASNVMIKFSTLIETFRNIMVFVLTLISSIPQEGSITSILPLLCGCVIITGCGILSLRSHRHSSMLDPLN